MRDLILRASYNQHMSIDYLGPSRPARVQPYFHVLQEVGVLLDARNVESLAIGPTGHDELVPAQRERPSSGEGQVVCRLRDLAVLGSGRPRDPVGTGGGGHTLNCLLFEVD